MEQQPRGLLIYDLFQTISTSGTVRVRAVCAAKEAEKGNGEEQSRLLSYLGSSSHDGGQALVSEVLEVFGEELCKILRDLFKLLLSLPVLGPCQLWLEHIQRHVLDAALGHHETENRHLLPLGIRKVGEGAVMDGVDELARVLQAAAAASAAGPAHPSGVHKVGRGPVLLKLRSEHLRIDGGVPHKEGSSEARGECRLRLSDTVLCAGDLGRVAGDEVVHDLVPGEL
mmetsp:Transcript_64962/g.139123  ORF Transcript_64962/g.139123 Transcript_64962/m.139123 type:complete len:227 (-) Transcript_64962:1440-2120(-)